MSGLRAIVTGGASGLGRAVAARLARNGGSVVIADLPTSAGESVAAELGDNVAFAPTDVRLQQKKKKARSFPLD